MVLVLSRRYEYFTMLALPTLHCTSRSTGRHKRREIRMMCGGYDGTESRRVLVAKKAGQRGV